MMSDHSSVLPTGMLRVGRRGEGGMKSEVMGGELFWIYLLLILYQILCAWLEYMIHINYIVEML